MLTLPRVPVAASAIRVVAIVTIFIGFAQTAQAQPTIDDVRDAWRQRQESVETLHIAWTVERTIVAGTMTNNLRILNRQDAEPPADLPPFPPVDTTLTSECKLFVSGDRARFNFDHNTYSFGQGELPRLRNWTAMVVFDGDRQTEFTEGRRTDGAPQAKIRPGRQSLTNEPYDCRTIVWCYRPLDIRRGGLHEDWLRLTGERMLIDGREHWGVCEEFSPTTFWVDPERDFLVSRVTRSQSLIIDIEYEPNGDGGWAPSGWTFEHLGDGVVTTRYSARIERLELNVELTDDLFTLEFPPGTHLSEYALGATRPERSVVGEDQR